MAQSRLRRCCSVLARSGAGVLFAQKGSWNEPTSGSPAPSETRSGIQAADVLVGEQWPLPQAVICVPSSDSSAKCRDAAGDMGLRTSGLNPQPLYSAPKTTTLHGVACTTDHSGLPAMCIPRSEDLGPSPSFRCGSIAGPAARCGLRRYKTRMTGNRRLQPILAQLVLRHRPFSRALPATGGRQGFVIQRQQGGHIRPF